MAQEQYKVFLIQEAAWSYEINMLLNCWSREPNTSTNFAYLRKLLKVKCNQI